jgi:hypothetical protein
MHTSIGVKVFVLTHSQSEVGAPGLAFETGKLRKLNNASVEDRARLESFTKLAYPVSITSHKAFKFHTGPVEGYGLQPVHQQP